MEVEEKEKPEAMETAAPPSNPYVDKLKRWNPDKEFPDDQIESSVIEAMDDYHGYKERTMEANKRLVEVLEQEPAIMNVIRDIAKGATLAEALSRNVDLDEIKPMEGDPDFETWNSNLESRKASMAERTAKQDSYAQNIKASMAELNDFATENGMDEGAVTEFLGMLNEFVSDIVDGKLNKANLMKFKKLKDYDTDLAAREEAARVAGRNEKIEAKREKMASASGDGLPNLTSGGGEMETPDPEMDDWAKAINKEKQRKKLT